MATVKVSIDIADTNVNVDINFSLDEVEADEDEIYSFIEEHLDDEVKIEYGQEYLEDHFGIDINAEKIPLVQTDMLTFFLNHIEWITLDDLISIVKTKYPGKELI